MTNEVSVELTLSLSPALHDLLVAELDSLGFEGFVQDEALFKAYVPQRLWDTNSKAYVKTWLANHNVAEEWEEAEITPRDWNKKWEDSIQPISIPPFYIRPSWALQNPELIDIVVDPKMSFGTGHHETTRLLLQLMPKFIKADDFVLDAGAGTAILAIAAIKLHAKEAIAFDTDAWVTDNVLENLGLNAVNDQISYREGAIDVVPESDFDVILANINRNALLAYLDEFASRLKKEGFLFLSGVLVEDQEFMAGKAAEAGFELVTHNHDGPWWAGVFKYVK